MKNSILLFQLILCTNLFATAYNVNSNIITYKNSGFSTITNCYNKGKSFNITGELAYSDVSAVTMQQQTVTGDSIIWIEAECGVVGSLWQVLSDVDASNGTYVEIQPGNNSSSAPTKEGATISYNFTINQETTYKVWGRCIAPSGSDDSYWIRIDGGGWIYNPVINSNTWVWDKVNDGANPQQNIQYVLLPGQHVLEIAFREDGTRIDKFYLTSLGDTPTSLGDEASNCMVSLPQKPTGLSATSISSSQIELVWTDNSDNEDGFIIERSTSDTSSYDSIATIPAGNTIFNDYNVSQNIIYYYRVKSFNVSGQSAASEKSSEVIHSVVNNLGNTTIFESNTAALTRRAVSYTMPENGIISSVVMFHGGGGGDAVFAVYNDQGGIPGQRLAVSKEIPVNSTEGWQDFKLIEPVEVSQNQPLWFAWVYEYSPNIYYTESTPARIDAGTDWSGGMPEDFGSGSFDNYIYSIYAKYGPIDGQVPDIPTAPSSLSALATSSTSIELTWGDNSDNEVGFIIERSTSSNANYSVIDTVDSNIADYLDLELLQNTTYYYRIKAYNANGESGYSNNTSVTTPLPDTRSIWLEAECGIVGSLWLILSDSEASNKEYVEIQPGNSSSGTAAPTEEGATISYTFTINQEAIYEIWGRVIAPSEFDDSYWIRIDGGSWINNAIRDSNSWLWDKVNDDTTPGQTIQYTLSPGQHILEIAYREDGTKIDKFYITSLGDTPIGLGSEASNCGGTPPQNPTVLSATSISLTQINLTWVDNSDNEDGFIIEMLSNGAWVDIDTINENTIVSVITGFVPNTTYSFRVKAYNVNGNSLPSNTLMVITPGFDHISINTIGLTGDYDYRIFGGALDSLIHHYNGTELLFNPLITKDKEEIKIIFSGNEEHKEFQIKFDVDRDFYINNLRYQFDGIIVPMNYRFYSIPIPNQLYLYSSNQNNNTVNISGLSGITKTSGQDITINGFEGFSDAIVNIYNVNDLTTPVRVLSNGTFTWDGTDTAGNPVPNGVYKLEINPNNGSNIIFQGQILIK